MPRLPRKKWRLEETIKTRAHLQAVAKWKASELGYATSVRDHIGKAIDKIDPVELLAVIGLSIPIYSVMKTTPEILLQIETIAPQLINYKSMGQDLIDKITGTDQIKGITVEQKATLDRIRDTPDLPMFLIAFGIAYFAIKQGGSIVETIAGCFNLKVK